MGKRKGATGTAALTAKRPGGKYVMILRSVGNPDFGQYAPISEPAAVTGETLAAMVRAAEAYIAEWDLGGGNFVDPEVRTRDGKAVAWISYNGRVWDRPHTGENWKLAKEITGVALEGKGDIR